jgi:hypothetical protein
MGADHERQDENYLLDSVTVVQGTKRHRESTSVAARCVAYITRGALTATDGKAG